MESQTGFRSSKSSMYWYYSWNQVWKSKWIIRSTFGVKQGDQLVPARFLYCSLCCATLTTVDHGSVLAGQARLPSSNGSRWYMRLIYCTTFVQKFHFQDRSRSNFAPPMWIRRWWFTDATIHSSPCGDPYGHQVVSTVIMALALGLPTRMCSV